MALLFADFGWFSWHCFFDGVWFGRSTIFLDRCRQKHLVERQLVGPFVWLQLVGWIMECTIRCCSCHLVADAPSDVLAIQILWACRPKTKRSGCICDAIGLVANWNWLVAIWNWLVNDIGRLHVFGVAASSFFGLPGFFGCQLMFLILCWLLTCKG